MGVVAVAAVVVADLAWLTAKVLSACCTSIGIIQLAGHRECRVQKEGNMEIIRMVLRT